MPILEYSLRNLRVIREAEITAHGGINWFRGPNGSGKTTLIEAIHLLSTGRTFTGRGELEPLISDGEDWCRIKITTHEHERLHLYKKRGQDRRLQTDGAQEIRQQEAAQRLPMITLHRHSTLLVDGSAQYRRRYIDWGLFHGDPGYNQLQRQYNRLLRQRNASLRQGQPDRLIQTWDPALGRLAEEIHRKRQEHVDELATYVESLGRQFLPQHTLKIRLHPGWKADRPLEDVLRETLAGDRQKGYTTHGTHRADLRLYLDGHRIKDRLSRGEKNRLTITLRLAQLSWHRARLEKETLCLLDDFGAELDLSGGLRLLAILREWGIQTFITTPSHVCETYQRHFTADAMFHVKHGQVVIH